MIPNRLWSGFIPKDGPRTLQRAPTDEERATLQRRAAALAPAMLPFQRPEEDDRVAVAIADLYGSYRSMTERGENALARVRAASNALADMPAWAIEEACLDIRRRGYEVIEDGRSRLEQHWPPSDPEIHAVVAKAVTQRRSALASARALLAAPVEPAAPPKPPAPSVDASLAAFKRENADRHLAEIAAEDERREKQAVEHRRKHIDAILADYRRAGLDPPEVKDGFVTSLPMMLKCGWRIEQVGDRNKLIGPAPAPKHVPSESLGS